MKFFWLIPLIFSLHIYQNEISINSETIIVDRNKIPYEITKVSYENQMIQIEGWGYMIDTQHYRNESTHQYQLILLSDYDEIVIHGQNIRNTKTELMAYEGARTCDETEYNAPSNSCNYVYEYVGFRFSVPLESIIENEKYVFYLKVINLSSSETAMIALYNPETSNKEFTIDRFIYRFESTYHQTSIDVINTTVIARKSPGKIGTIVQSGLVCSTSYGENAYYQYQTTYHNIMSQTFVDDIRYFEVKSDVKGCVDQRSRLVEGNAISSYIPSVFVNYDGKPWTLMKMRQLIYPELAADNVTVKQHSNFNQLIAVKTDYEEDYERIIVLDRISTQHTGVYNQCFELTNNDSLTTKTCRIVEVIAANKRYRFISQDSLIEFKDNSLSLLIEMLNNKDVIYELEH